jgi:hypothetical protein
MKKNIITKTIKITNELYQYNTEVTLCSTDKSYDNKIKQLNKKKDLNMTTSSKNSS